GGTEANNLAIKGIFRAPGMNSRHLVISAVEHPSISRTAQALADTGEIQLDRCRVNREGLLDFDHLRELLKEETALVSVIVVQNEVGTLQNLIELRHLLDEYAPQALLHLDAVQAVGKVDLPFKEIRPDMISISGHKIHAPGGTGALLIRKDLKIEPLFHGGGQQNNLRSGSLDATGIIAFLLAGIQILANREAFATHVRSLRNRLIGELQKLSSQKGFPWPIHIVTPIDHASPYILSFLLKNAQGAVIARFLDEKDVCVGTGSACSAQKQGPSSTLLAMGYPASDAYGMLRVSFGCHSTWTECEAFLHALRWTAEVY
ncbi:MAG: aminotransferase class V-fold PLP-dependent enzyme, partial [Lentisphaerae bacterium]